MFFSGKMKHREQALLIPLHMVQYRAYPDYPTINSFQEAKN